MKETRLATIRSDDAEDAPRRLIGQPIVYDAPTVITTEDGRTYTEIIERGALDDAVIDDSTLIYNHDTNRVPLARTPKTMTLTVTDGGLEMVAELADTAAANEVYSAVKRGDLNGMSFAFTVPEGGSHYDAKTNTRRITKIAKVYEVSVVPFPAYPQTSVEARAQMDSRDGERRQLLIKANQILLRSI